MKSKGFTLIELLVVISIIGLLSSVVLASLNTARQKGRDARRLLDLHQIQNALELYALSNNGQYPTMPRALAGWRITYSRLQDTLQTGGYMTIVPQDPLFDGTSDTHTYYYWYCTSGSQTTLYRLLTFLETNNTVLTNDADGNFYGSDARCDDSLYGYCVGTTNWCY